MPLSTGKPTLDFISTKFLIGGNSGITYSQVMDGGGQNMATLRSDQWSATAWKWSAATGPVTEEYFLTGA